MAINSGQAARSPLRVPKIAELVADDIRKRIVTGQLQAGDTLPPEAELLKSFGISRPTLREAIRVLESESLLDIHRGVRGGARVRAPQADAAARYAGLVLQYEGTRLGDVHAARLAIEPRAAGLLASSRGESDLAALRSCLDECQRALDAEELAEYARASYEFHSLVVDRAGNRTLTLFSRMIADIVAAHDLKVATTPRPDGDVTKQLRGVQASHAAHARLVDLVAARDAGEAQEYWFRHLRAAERYYAERSGDLALDLFG